MVYVLYGKIDYLINKQIKNIIKDNNIDDINIIKYDFQIWRWYKSKVLK